jgi:hypothetical protein
MYKRYLMPVRERERRERKREREREREERERAVKRVWSRRRHGQLSASFALNNHGGVMMG